MPIEIKGNDVVLTSSSTTQTQVRINLFGATVYSWTIAGKEQLWTSDAALFDGSKPIRGGIPLVFPVFGKSSAPGFEKLPQHGFARNSTWEFLGQTHANPPTVQFGLSPDNVNRKVYNNWDNGDNEFSVIYTIALEDEQLVTSVEIQNTDQKEWKFNWLFHTYFLVDDIEDTLINNLPGEKCNDRVVHEIYIEKHPIISFDQEVDRVYSDVSTDKLLQIIELGKVKHNIKRVNLPDVVVWNPWSEIVKEVADFEPKEGYRRMVCVEPGYVEQLKILKPGQSWTASQILHKGDDINLQAI
ncbi:hypothetical protein LJB42_002374 [Komagataella kurtzmanii]|nr:hypothetical protein LJB42_002374 [Komagataella kurtzmanii]